MLHPEGLIRRHLKKIDSDSQDVTGISNAFYDDYGGLICGHRDLQLREMSYCCTLAYTDAHRFSKCFGNVSILPQ